MVLVLKRYRKSFVRCQQFNSEFRLVNCSNTCINYSGFGILEFVLEKNFLSADMVVKVHGCPDTLICR